MKSSRLLYSVALLGCFSAVLPTKAAQPADSVLKAGTLFIEAEDFNFGHGKWIKDKPIGMTGKYAGGLYQDMGDGLDGANCDGSDVGIDYFETVPGNAQTIYRGPTGVEAGKLNGPAGVSRGTFDVEINHTVGWNDAGDWYNYTRKFPEPAQIYKVYARMATGGADRHAQLDRVTSDPTKCNQTVEKLGTFDGPTTGGWDTWPDAGTSADAMVPLRDASGADALVSLGGELTLRFTVLPGNLDVDYLAFVSTGLTALPPKVTSLTPTAGSSGQSDLPAIEAVIEDSAVTKVASAALKLDGAAVNATVQRTGNTTKVSYRPTAAFAAGSSHTITLIHTDDSKPPVSRTNDATFRVSFVPFRSDTLFIEAEDFNFGKGQWIKDKPIGMTGAYPGGDYKDKGDGAGGADCDGSSFGIDYLETNASNDGGAVPAYRVNTGVEIAKPNGPAGVNRGTFQVKVNNTVGWNDSGDWYNYTRKFPEPAQAYKVYARLATGGQDRHAQLDRVTSDPTKCNQTLQKLGNFDAPTTGGWDTWPDAGTAGDALVPLRNEAGIDALVTLGGDVTLRFTVLPGNLDVDYLAFIPVGSAPVVTSLKPAPTQGLGPSGASEKASIEATIEDLVQKVASASLKLDGNAVAAKVERAGTTTRVSFVPTTAFVPGSSHTASLTYTDNSTPAVTKTVDWSFRVSILSSKTLFIESEDFNYGKGQWIKDKPIGMTGKYDGGLYQDLGDGIDGADCDGSNFGIDYHEAVAGNAQTTYRGPTGVEAGKLNGPAGAARGPFDVTVNHVVGWNDAGDWYNYTRKFPEPAQVYKVYARMATGGADRHAQLDRVTSDPTKCNQTLQKLGNFDAPTTGGWDTWPDSGTANDALVPLRDASGADALVKLSGDVTLRFTVLPGNLDIDYIAFVPSGSGGLPPKITSIKPVTGASGQSDLPTIEALIEDGEVEKVATAALKLDGTAVNATVSKSGSITSVRFTPASPLAPGSSHSVNLSFTDTASPPVTRTADSTFRVSFVPFRTGTLFIEAEDFNFGKGQWIKEKPIGMTGPYPGGDYKDKGNGLNGALGDGSDFGIDYFENPASNDQAIYRPNTGVEAGKLNGPAGFNRGTFNVTVNHTVGWNNEGEWYNYTRVFPANTYKVYARAATDVGQTRNTQLSRVTGDPSKPNQTVVVLGTFNGPSTGGWDTWPDAGTPADALLPLKDASGKEVVLQLGGELTLRYTFLPGASDIDYLAFLPATPTPSGPKFTSIKKNANGSLTLEWTGGGVLQSATSVLGPWVDVPGATSPFTFTPTAAQKILFGRIKL